MMVQKIELGGSAKACARVKFRVRSSESSLLSESDWNGVRLFDGILLVLGGFLF